MVVLDPNKAFDGILRLSYVMWQEQVPPTWSSSSLARERKTRIWERPTDSRGVR